MTEFIMEHSGLHYSENAAGRKSFPRRELFFAARVAAPDTHVSNGVKTMRGILMWLVGIPIPIIILLFLFNVV